MTLSNHHDSQQPTTFTLNTQCYNTIYNQHGNKDWG